MRFLPIICLTSSLLVAPVAAQEADVGEGLTLMEEGARLLFRGLLSEIDPAIEDFRDFADELGPTMRLFAEEMGPALAELMAQVDDLTNYAAPEFLPNGDIIIRRKPDAPEYLPDLPEQDDFVDL